MTHELTTEFETEAKKVENRPVELLDIYLGSQNAADSETYYFATDNTKVTFWNLDGDVKTYLPMRVKRSAIPVSNQLEIEAISGEFDNVDGLWSSWLSNINMELRGKRIVIRKVFLDLLSDETHAKVMFDGIINSIPELTEKSVKVECKSKIKPLDVETGRMQQLFCGWIYGDEFCNSTPVTANGATVDSGSTTTAIIDAARNEADDFWKDGVITFTSGQNNGQRRKVVAFDNASHTLTLDYALPYVPQAGDSYNIEQGCDKTYSTCAGRFSNQANFGGFKEIPPLINPRL